MRSSKGTQHIARTVQNVGAWLLQRAEGAAFATLDFLLPVMSHGRLQL